MKQKSKTQYGGFRKLNGLNEEHVDILACSMVKVSGEVSALSMGEVLSGLPAQL